ncbi:unnamed protein product [Amoebophrya sp. A25]|nr:unnamed protein product [Amoebophrya sp. A25]|eukprot:GSA25T00004287001.1
MGSSPKNGSTARKQAKALRRLLASVPAVASEDTTTTSTSKKAATGTPASQLAATAVKRPNPEKSGKSPLEKRQKQDGEKNASTTPQKSVTSQSFLLKNEANNDIKVSSAPAPAFSKIGAGEKKATATTTGSDTKPTKLMAAKSTTSASPSVKTTLKVSESNKITFTSSKKPSSAFDDLKDTMKSMTNINKQPAGVYSDEDEEEEYTFEEESCSDIEMDSKSVEETSNMKMIDRTSKPRSDDKENNRDQSTVKKSDPSGTDSKDDAKKEQKSKTSSITDMQPPTSSTNVEKESQSGKARSPVSTRYPMSSSSAYSEDEEEDYIDQEEEEELSESLNKIETAQAPVCPEKVTQTQYDATDEDEEEEAAEYLSEEEDDEQKLPAFDLSDEEEEEVSEEEEELSSDEVSKLRVGDLRDYTHERLVLTGESQNHEKLDKKRFSCGDFFILSGRVLKFRFLAAGKDESTAETEDDTTTSTTTINENLDSTGAIAASCLGADLRLGRWYTASCPAEFAPLEVRVLTPQCVRLQLQTSSGDSVRIESYSKETVDIVQARADLWTHTAANRLVLQLNTTFSASRNSRVNAFDDIICNTSGGPAPLFVPERWLDLRDHAMNKRCIAVMGAKSTGKSTLQRYLANALVSAPPLPSKSAKVVESKEKQDGPLATSGRSRGRRVFYLDADLGQPELTAPGFVSLAELSSPLLQSDGALGCFLTTAAQNHGDSSPAQFLHKRFLGAVSPESDPLAYLAAVEEAIQIFRDKTQDVNKEASTSSSAEEDVVLLVNLPGWITGLGYHLCQKIVGMTRTDLLVRIGVEFEKLQYFADEASPFFGASCSSPSTRHSSGVEQKSSSSSSSSLQHGNKNSSGINRGKSFSARGDEASPRSPSSEGEGDALSGFPHSWSSAANDDAANEYQSLLTPVHAVQAVWTPGVFEPVDLPPFRALLRGEALCFEDETFLGRCNTENEKQMNKTTPASTHNSKARLPRELRWLRLCAAFNAAHGASSAFSNTTSSTDGSISSYGSCLFPQGPGELQRPLRTFLPGLPLRVPLELLRGGVAQLLPFVGSVVGLRVSSSLHDILVFVHSWDEKDMVLFVAGDSDTSNLLESLNQSTNTLSSLVSSWTTSKNSKSAVEDQGSVMMQQQKNSSSKTTSSSTSSSTNTREKEISVELLPAACTSFGWPHTTGSTAAARTQNGPFWCRNMLEGVEKGTRGRSTRGDLKRRRLG